MNDFVKIRPPHGNANAGLCGSPARWQIGAGTVSTEELQAWQLGPARIERWLAAPDSPLLD